MSIDRETYLQMAVEIAELIKENKRNEERLMKLDEILNCAVMVDADTYLNSDLSEYAQYTKKTFDDTESSWYQKRLEEVKDLELAERIVRLIKREQSNN